jgi:simple sugar transport system substrate-binding protein
MSALQRWAVWIALGLCAVGAAWAQAPAEPGTAAKRPRIAFIGHSPDGERWWDPVKNGLADARADFDIDVDFLNPADGSIEAMARIIAGLSPEKYDGVVSTIADFGKLEQPLAALVKSRKLLLVTANTGTHAQSEAVGALLHVGQPEELAGRLAGEQARKAGVTSFVCINRYIANAATRERCDGFAAGLGLRGTGPQLEVKGSDAEMEADVLRFVEANPQVGALLTMGPSEAHPTIAALRRLKPTAKKPYFVAFDLSKPITAAIVAGTIDFAIDQQPYLQGYLPAALLARRIRHPGESLLMTKVTVFAEAKLHARVARYGVAVKPGEGRHLNSGPGFVSRVNVDKVQLYGGLYR